MESVLGLGVARARVLGGGQLSRVRAVTLTDGREVVVKEAAGAGREAAMLEAMAAAGVPCPAVLDRARDRLVLSRLAEDGGRSGDGWRQAGRAVRRLHEARGAVYGWPEDHAFGDVAIPGAPAADWPTFWAERRLLAWPEALPTGIARRLERLAATLADRLPGEVRPSLLHGDLWSGNLLFQGGAFVGLIDPACCYGDGEVDLAMLALFGGLSPEFLEGYGATPAPERRAIYQLWPALVHLRLFGARYRGLVEGLLSETGV